MAARKFFYICAGTFLLALAYHLGASSAQAIGHRVVTQELVVTDDAGRQRVTISAGYGGPTISLADETGHPTVFLAGGAPFDKKLRKGPFGGYLGFYDSRHQCRALLGLRGEMQPDGWPTPDGPSGLTLFDKNGGMTWATPAK